MDMKQLTGARLAGLLVAAVAVLLAVVLLVTRPWEPTYDADQLQACTVKQAIQSSNDAYTEEQVRAEFEACREAAKN